MHEGEARLLVVVIAVAKDQSMNDCTDYVREINEYKLMRHLVKITSAQYVFRFLCLVYVECNEGVRMVRDILNDISIIKSK